MEFESLKVIIYQSWRFGSVQFQFSSISIKFNRLTLNQQGLIGVHGIHRNLPVFPSEENRDNAIPTTK